MKIILASASPRRQELLKHIFSEFTVIPAKEEEKAIFHSPDQYAQDLSGHKAHEIARMYFQATPASTKYDLKEIANDSLTLILGADTIVYASGKVLGKPSDPKEAREMLSMLSGKSHKVYTGVTLLIIRSKSDATGKNPPINELIVDHSFSEETEVIVDKLTEKDIDAYIAGKDPFDKAGSYGIQGSFSKHIIGIRGDYFNVVGLPVSRIYREFNALWSH